MIAWFSPTSLLRGFYQLLIEERGRRLINFCCGGGLLKRHYVISGGEKLFLFSAATLDTELWKEGFQVEVVTSMLLLHSSTRKCALLGEGRSTTTSLPLPSPSTSKARVNNPWRLMAASPVTGDGDCGSLCRLPSVSLSLSLAATLPALHTRRR